MTVKRGTVCNKLTMGVAEHQVKKPPASLGWLSSACLASHGWARRLSGRVQGMEVMPMSEERPCDASCSCWRFAYVGPWSLYVSSTGRGSSRGFPKAICFRLASCKEPSGIPAVLQNKTQQLHSGDRFHIASCQFRQAWNTDSLCCSLLLTLLALCFYTWYYPKLKTAALFKTSPFWGSAHCWTSEKPKGLTFSLHRKHLWSLCCASCLIASAVPCLAAVPVHGSKQGTAGTCSVAGAGLQPGEIRFLNYNGFKPTEVI